MTTSTYEFQETTPQAPNRLASTNRSSSMVSEDSSEKTDGSEFGFENDDDHDSEMDDAGDTEGDEPEDDSDEDGDKMDEDEDDGGRFEKINGERRTPTRAVEITDVDGDKAFSQELPTLEDTNTHPSNASTRMLPSSFPTTSNPASTHHRAKTSSPLPPPLTQNPLPSTSASNQALPPSGDDVNSRPKRKVRARVLQDQGILESGGECAAEHCEEPERVDEMVSCAGVGCNDQVCFPLMLRVVQLLISSALGSFI